MLLGDVIRRLEDETIATETVLRIGDLGLLAEMEARAEEAGVSLGTFAAWAIRQYADNAAADEWTTLMGALERSEDPGVTCLQRAFGYVLAGHDSTAGAKS